VHFGYIFDQLLQHFEATLDENKEWNKTRKKKKRKRIQMVR